MRAAALIAVLFNTTACGREPAREMQRDPAPAVVNSISSAPVAAAASNPPRPRPIAAGRVAALSAAEIAAADLNGELACSFADERGAVLFHGAGNVGTSRAAEGIVKLNAAVAKVTAPGGFDRMQRGTSFASPAVSVRIGAVGEPVGGGESPARPATLSWTAGDGTGGSVAGRWTCGP